MGKEGLEPVQSSPKNLSISDPCGAQSGAVPADLKYVVDTWVSLTEDDRRRIRSIVDGRFLATRRPVAICGIPTALD